MNIATLTAPSIGDGNSAETAFRPVFADAFAYAWSRSMPETYAMIAPASAIAALLAACGACALVNNTPYRMPDLGVLYSRHPFLYEIYREPLRKVKLLPHIRAGLKQWGQERIGWRQSLDGTQVLVAMRQPSQKAFDWAFEQAVADGHITQAQHQTAKQVYLNDGYLPLLNAIESVFGLNRLHTSNIDAARRYLLAHADEWEAD